MQRRSIKTLGSVLFLLGVFLSLALALAAIWGDYEAMSYFFNGAGYGAFDSLNCPVLMSRTEVATISATFDNPSDAAIQPYYEVEVSATASSRDLEKQITVPPHTSRTVQWTVDANDLNLGSFILIKMDVLPVAGFSTREATCGVLLLNLAGPSGERIVGAVLAVSLLGILLGLGIRDSGERAATDKALSTQNGMRATGVAALLALLAGLMGWWLIGVLFMAGTMLLLAILLRLALS